MNEGVRDASQEVGQFKVGSPAMILLYANAVVILYGLLAFTYGTAAILYRHMEHRPLAACYGVSCLLHGLLGICHLLHLG